MTMDNDVYGNTATSLLRCKKIGAQERSANTRRSVDRRPKWKQPRKPARNEQGHPAELKLDPLRNCGLHSILRSALCVINVPAKTIHHSAVSPVRKYSRLTSPHKT